MKQRAHESSSRIVPLGTQIVTRSDTKSPEGHFLQAAGADAVIVEAPPVATGSYRVRFPDGSTSFLLRRAFQIRRQLARELDSERTTPQYELFQFVIYRCVVGSRAYGLDVDGSDIDRRGIYLPPADLQWSLYGLPEQIERQDTQECYWELEKFLRLALRANPNVLECLYSPLVEFTSPIAGELLEMRATFLTRMVYQTYNGYVLSQFKKLGQDLRNKGALRWKHAMHLIRLLISGITILREQTVPVRVSEYRSELLAIRRGECSWREVDEWRKKLHKEFDAAWWNTRLPHHPDLDRVNTFLLRARLSMVQERGDL